MKVVGLTKWTERTISFGRHRFVVFTAACLQIMVFRVVTSCNFTSGYRFGQIYCHHQHGSCDFNPEADDTMFFQNFRINLYGYTTKEPTRPQFYSEISQRCKTYALICWKNSKLLPLICVFYPSFSTNKKKNTHPPIWFSKIWVELTITFVFVYTSAFVCDLMGVTNIYPSLIIFKWIVKFS